MEPLRFPPDTTASQVLDAIEQWARTTTAMENSLLWSVLSALRGPDTPNDAMFDIKTGTTMWIRGASLPTLAARAGADVNRQPLRPAHPLRRVRPARDASPAGA